MVTAKEILERSGIKFERFAESPNHEVYLTLGNQLLGTYAQIKAFQRARSNKDYHGWHAHHIFEKEEARSFHVAGQSPGPDDQLCVLLPKIGHGKRVHSVLNFDKGAAFTPRDRLDAYRDAYALLGDYSGGGELLIKRELVAVVEATMKCFGLL